MEEEESGEDSVDFRCTFTTSFGTFLKLLESLLWKKNQSAMVTITSAGMKFVIDHDEVLQADVQIHAEEMCDTFWFKEGVSSVQFCIDLRVLNKCLYAASENCNAEMVFDRDEMSLTVLIMEGPFSTQAVIKCMEPIETSEPEFRKHNLLTSIIFNPDALKDIFSEVDVFGDKDSEVAMRVTSEEFELEVHADLGIFHGKVPLEQDMETVQEIKHKEDFEFFYLLSLLRPAFKAVTKATTTQIDVNQMGQIKILHRLGNNRMQFIAAPRSDWDAY